MEEEELIRLNNFCADLVSLKRWEAFPLTLLIGKCKAEWVRVRDLCLQCGLEAEELRPDLFATWLPDTAGDEGYALILFYDEESMWTMAARCNRQRLLQDVPWGLGRGRNVEGMTTPLARITWLTPEEGGRRQPPPGPRYSAPARFEGQAAGSEGANWSLVVDLQSRPSGATDWIAEVRYLVDEAPHELLRLGACFELYEGKKCVARGVIISPVLETVNLSGIRPAVEQAEAKH